MSCLNDFKAQFHITGGRYLESDSLLRVIESQIKLRLGVCQGQNETWEVQKYLIL